MIKPNSIICCDVIEGLRDIEDNSVHIIICSPPYNVGIDYSNYSDNLPHKEYLDWTKDVWKECYRVLVRGGRICINIDATMNLEGSPENRKERVHPLHVDFTNQLRDIGYLYRGEIGWFKQNAPGKNTAWGSYCLPSNPHIRRNHEYVILASKETLKLEGDHMMSDITPEEFHAWTLSEWSIKPETIKRNHPAPFPRQLVERCVKLFTFVGNVVLDPFNGSGTTTSTAFELGRKYIGIDNSEKYCKIARKYIQEIESDLGGGYSFVPSPELLKQKKSKTNKEDSDIFD